MQGCIFAAFRIASSILAERFDFYRLVIEIRFNRLSKLQMTCKEVFTSS